MVTTEMVSSTSNTARGFLPGGGLAAGPVATSSKILNIINQSGEEIQKVMMQVCSDCGRGVGEEELHLTLQGYYVVGLFPAMTS